MNYSEIIKEVGRGRTGATDLSEDAAFELFGAMLHGQVPDLELGALLLAFRIKGESPNEMRGFYRAMQAIMPRLEPPVGRPLPILLPTYNGARRQGNLTPLLAMLLQKLGVPVLVHGVQSDSKRVTSREVFAALGVPMAESITDVQTQLDAGQVAFLPIDVLSPGLNALLQLRGRLGVRNSTHTLVKLADPFAGRALPVVSVSHPEYVIRMAEFFRDIGARALLLRGTEGEVYANPKRCPRMAWFEAGQETVLAEAEEGTVAAVPQLPESMEAEITANWIRRALAGDVPVPQTILTQVACCLVATRVKSDMAAALAAMADGLA